MVDGCWLNHTHTQANDEWSCVSIETNIIVNHISSQQSSNATELGFCQSAKYKKIGSTSIESQNKKKIHCS